MGLPVDSGLHLLPEPLPIFLRHRLRELAALPMAVERSLAAWAAALFRHDRPSSSSCSFFSDSKAKRSPAAFLMPTQASSTSSIFRICSLEPLIFRLISTTVR